jgi:4-nitrophenyl phosphatase
MVDLTKTRTVLFDMDGVLYRGSQVLPGARELLAFLDASDVRYACITNNASMTPAEYETKLAKMGIPMPADLVLTSALVTGHYLRKQYPRGTRVLIVGMGGLREALLGDGHFVEDEATPELVVQGADFKLTYDRLKLATLAIRRGARYIATNPDRTFPSEEGLIPGAGAVMAALVAATDAEPLVIGKPAPTMFQVAVDMLGGKPDTTLVIGDRLDTDIGGAINAGLPSLMVLTGVSTRAEAEVGPIRPDVIYNDLPTLLADWQAAR